MFFSEWIPNTNLLPILTGSLEKPKPLPKFLLQKRTYTQVPGVSKWTLEAVKH